MEKRRKTLKALLIGINEYGIKEHSLKGCEFDVEAIHRFLVKYCAANDILLDVITLLNQKATYQQLVDTFQTHFSTLIAGDQALLYFSGHGSYTNAPKEFMHNSLTNRLGTYVLYDSRTNGGFDLVDKELSYLIWSVTKEINVLFTVITDCCHSGLQKIGGGFRPIPPSFYGRHWQDFLGSKYYYYSKHNKVIVPASRSIHLASCNEYELSKEKKINGQIRGIFTYCLIFALEQSNGKISYQDLMLFTRARVRSIVDNQTPQVQSTFSIDKNMLFLKNVLEENSFNHNHLLFYDRIYKGWLTNLGGIHGLKPGDHLRLHKLLDLKNHLLKPGKKTLDLSSYHIVTSDVTTDWSKVILPAALSLDRTKSYHTTFEYPLDSPIKFAFTTDSDLECLRLLKKEWQEAPSQYLKLTNTWQDAQYLIHSKGNRFWIHAMDEIINQRLRRYKMNSTKQVIKTIKTIAYWEYIKILSNGITANDLELDVEVQFREILKTSQDFMHSVEERVFPFFLTKQPVLTYRLDGSEINGQKWKYEPMFRLKIKNQTHSLHKLWVSMLYLGSDFSITNDLKPIQKLYYEEETWLEVYDFNRQIFTNVIPIGINNFYLNNGVNETIEHFKVIISKYEFSTDSLNQEGLSFKDESDVSSRGTNRKGRNLEVSHKDWTSIDFSIRISY